jgi:ComF family protein
MRYAAPASQMILRLKFSGSSVDARVLGSLLARAVDSAYATRPPVDVIVPVPLGNRRLRRRGHNQAAMLARWVGRDTGIAVDYTACTRRRNTVAQTDLGRRARLRNLRGAFAVDRGFAGARIAIVDDVMTTGATVTALAQALLARDAGDVHVWAVARTMEPQPQRAPHVPALPCC